MRYHIPKGKSVWLTHPRDSSMSSAPHQILTVRDVIYDEGDILHKGPPVGINGSPYYEFKLPSGLKFGRLQVFLLDVREIDDDDDDDCDFD